MTLDEFVARIKEHRRYHYIRIISWTIAILLSTPLLIINAYVSHLFGFIISASVITLGIFLIKNSYTVIVALKDLKKWADDRLKDIPGTQEVNIKFFDDVDPSDKEE